MKICGLQETTLIDYPGKIACTLFLYGCNFKCGFCHNPELVIEENTNILSEEKIMNFLEKRQGQLDGVCITGGEPLLRLDENFLREIKKLGYSIKIDTNGSSPERIRRLVREKLVDYIAMDIKASAGKYAETTNTRVDLNRVEESIKLISSLENYEFRTTVVESIHNLGEMIKIAHWLNKIIGKKPKKFIIQGFKNQGKLINPAFKEVMDTREEDLERLKIELKDYFEKVEIRV